MGNKCLSVFCPCFLPFSSSERSHASDATAAADKMAEQQKQQQHQYLYQVQQQQQRQLNQARISKKSDPYFSVKGGNGGGGGGDRSGVFYSKFPLPLTKNSVSERARGNHYNKESFSESKATALFEKYYDKDEDSILSEGILKFCSDLELRPEELRVLLLAWKFQAERMCVFTRSEFLHGCKTLRADNVKTMKDRLPDLLNEVAVDEDKFKDLYRFTFRFGLEPGMRVLPRAIAIALWKLVFSLERVPILERWLAFLEKHQVKGIPRDTWNMFLNFVMVVGDDLSVYDDTEAWPSVFDDFVEYETDARNQNTCEIISKSTS